MRFWSSQTLKVRTSADQLVVLYDESRVVHCAYESGVGGEAFVTSNPSDKTQVSAGAKIVIPPGQFGRKDTHWILSRKTAAANYLWRLTKRRHDRGNASLTWGLDSTARLRHLLYILLGDSR